MKNLSSPHDILGAAVALSDGDLLARIETLARTERSATAGLIAHLVALEMRPSLYLAQGHGSLFEYCVGALHLTEDAACNRIKAGRVCRRFPVLFDLLASGAISVSAVRVLGPHLTQENHESVLARAANARRGAIEALVAELAPKADVAASVRKLPTRQVPVPRPSPSMAGAWMDARPARERRTPDTSMELAAGDPAGTSAAEPTRPSASSAPTWSQRSTIRASAPSRYKVQFTIGQDAHDKLRRVQALLRREIPSGDTGAIFESALDLLSAKVEREKLGHRRRAVDANRPPYESRIRRAADGSAGSAACGHPSRHIPNRVRREVWLRDGARCAFVSERGRRCEETAFLELHHIQPFALDGPATTANISLRCRGHNRYESEMVFRPWVPMPPPDSPDRSA